MSASRSGGRHRQLSVPRSRGKRDGEGMETRGVTWPPHDGLKGQAKARDSDECPGTGWLSDAAGTLHAHVIIACQVCSCISSAQNCAWHGGMRDKYLLSI